MLATIIYFFIALLLLITIHEYGHFIVARLCGVKVLRFSFGFGKVLARFHDKKGTEYAFSVVPLGGYVKMLDESEGEVAEEDKDKAFNRKPLWQKTLIVLAGPLFNFIFAFVALWLVALIGIKTLAPMIDGVTPGGLAAQAGLTGHQEILSLNGEPVNSWRDFQFQIMSYVGSDETLKLKVKSLKTNHSKTFYFSLKNWEIDSKNPDLLNSLGIIPFIPSIPSMVGKVLPDAPAAGKLQAGDQIIDIDGLKTDDWMQLLDYVRKRPNQSVNLKVKRQGNILSVNIKTGMNSIDGKPTGFLGIESKKPEWPNHWLRYQHEGPFAAIPLAFSQTLHLSGSTLTLIGRLLTGKVSVDNISGPIGIAKGAGDSAKGGFVYYLSFLALVSISLGILNLMPVPMLDGGHLLYYLIEAIRRKPLTDEVKGLGMYLGLLLLAGLMVIALFNDISRLT